MTGTAPCVSFGGLLSSLVASEGGDGDALVGADANGAVNVRVPGGDVLGKRKRPELLQKRRAWSAHRHSCSGSRK